MDIMRTTQLVGFDTTFKGIINDYSQTQNSDVVVIISGVQRKPDMTREEIERLIKAYRNKETIFDW